MAPTKAETKLAKARTRLMISTDANLVFFGELCRIECHVGKTQGGTAETDGKTVRWEPDFIEQLSDKEVLGVLVHEYMHVALGHLDFADKDPELWNIAADLAINGIIKHELKLTIPESGPYAGLFPGQGKYAAFPKLQTSEAYYKLLLEQQAEQNGDGQNGDGESGGEFGANQGNFGRIIPVSPEEAEAIKSLVKEAHREAKNRGTLNQKLDSLIESGLVSRIDYRIALRQFRNAFIRGGSDWARPNRRHISRGMYIATNRKQVIKNVVASIDVSGSIGEGELNAFVAELRAIALEIGCKMILVWHSHEVLRVDELDPKHFPAQLTSPGTGGTSHIEVFETISNNPQWNPAFIACLTDMYSEFPKVPPAVPVLWIAPDDCGQSPGWGKMLNI